MSQDADARALEANARNRVRIRPSAQEITRMEIVLAWPARHLVEHTALRTKILRRVVQVVAMLRSRDYDLEKISRKLKMGPRHVRRINREALDIIATGLRRSGEPIF
jgi:AraC-like DNA-binding protein